MTPVLDEHASRSATPRDPPPDAGRLTTARPADTDQVALRGTPPRAPAQPLHPVPRFHCGWCRAPIENLGARHHVRCDACGRNVAVPAYLTVPCERCGNTTRIAPRKLAGKPLCPACGLELKIGDLVLTPRRRRHRTRRGQHRALSPYGDAAWAMLIIGLTLVILVLSLTML